MRFEFNDGESFSGTWSHPTVNWFSGFTEIVWDSFYSRRVGYRGNLQFISPSATPAEAEQRASAFYFVIGPNPGFVFQLTRMTFQLTQAGPTSSQRSSAIWALVTNDAAITPSNGFPAGKYYPETVIYAFPWTNLSMSLSYPSYTSYEVQFPVDWRPARSGDYFNLRIYGAASPRANITSSFWLDDNSIAMDNVVFYGSILTATTTRSSTRTPSTTSTTSRTSTTLTRTTSQTSSTTSETRTSSTTSFTSSTTSYTSSTTSFTETSSTTTETTSTTSFTSTTTSQTSSTTSMTSSTTSETETSTTTSETTQTTTETSFTTSYTSSTTSQTSSTTSETTSSTSITTSQTSSTASGTTSQTRTSSTATRTSSSLTTTRTTSQTTTTHSMSTTSTTLDPFSRFTPTYQTPRFVRLVHISDDGSERELLCDPRCHLVSPGNGTAFAVTCPQGVCTDGVLLRDFAGNGGCLETSAMRGSQAVQGFSAGLGSTCPDGPAWEAGWWIPERGQRGVLINPVSELEGWYADFGGACLEAAAGDPSGQELEMWFCDDAEPGRWEARDVPTAPWKAESPVPIPIILGSALGAATLVSAALLAGFKLLRRPPPPPPEEPPPEGAMVRTYSVGDLANANRMTMYGEEVHGEESAEVGAAESRYAKGDMNFLES